MLGIAARKCRRPSWRAATGWRSAPDGDGGGAAGGGAARRPVTIPLVNAPAEALPFATACSTAAMIAFGIRNVPDYRAGLREMLRVLRPGGRIVVLEFSTPPSRLLWRVYNWYFFNVLAAHRRAHHRQPGRLPLPDPVGVRVPRRAGVRGRPAGVRLRAGDLAVDDRRHRLRAHGRAP